MFRQVVLVTFFPEVPSYVRARVTSALQTIKDRVSEVIDWQVGLERSPSSTTCDLALIGTFRDQAGFEAYQKHPVVSAIHEALVRVADWRVVDYDMPPSKGTYATIVSPTEPLPLLSEDALRRNPSAFFATVAHELRSAGLPPGTWFELEGGYRLRGWKFEREPWLWRATTTDRPIPRALAEKFTMNHKGLDMRAPNLMSYSATTRASFAAFVELVKSLPES
jgi:hypothetical protein